MNSGTYICEKVAKKMDNVRDMIDLTVLLPDEIWIKIAKHLSQE